MSEASKPIVAVDRKARREYRYQTKGVLGSGASGDVYLAVRLPEGTDVGADDARRVALKLAYNAQWKRHLADEGRLLHRLQERAHPDTAYRPVRIHSGPEPLSVDDDRGALIELEYLDGITLRQWFDEDWASAVLTPAAILDEVLTIARQLAEALVQLQDGDDVGLIHRDLKPENLMRTSRGLRLFDFNVAREDTGGTKTSYVGSQPYMAPEVLDRSPDYDARADLFSVGLILWEIAHQKRFDRPSHLVRKDERQVLRWPSSRVADWPEPERAALGELLPAMICDVAHRLPSARALLGLVERLEAPRRAERRAADPLAPLDMIQLLSELRPSGLASVVSDTSGPVAEQALQDFLRARMQVDDPLENWLVGEVEKASSADSKVPALFVLAGNAGDGKSHLLSRLLKHRLAGRPEVRRRIKAITDATHALTPNASQMDRLAEFFLPFADRDAAESDQIHLIAMNTGMVIRFFESDQARCYRQLYGLLQHRLGLRRDASAAEPPWRVEVLNLDLRDLLAPTSSGESFAERMIRRLDPENEDGIAGRKWSTCKTCSAFALCPVAFNLRAAARPQVRTALLRTLRRVALDTDVHLSPRNVWGFLYRLVTGGVERYEMSGGSGPTSPCDVVRRRTDAGTENDGAWLLEGQFTELLFQQPGAGAPWSALVRHDPAFSTAPTLDRLHTRLSIKTELDNDPSIVEGELGGSGRTLAGLSLDALTSKLPNADFRGRRRDAAVRRQVMFHGDTFDAWADDDGSTDFERMLIAYDDYSRNDGEVDRLATATKTSLKQLRQLVQDVFLKGNGREIAGNAYLRVSQPNVRARTELLVRADRSALDELFHLKRIIAADVHVLAHRGRQELLQHLGYRPTQVTLQILGVRLTIDLALFEFLRRVDTGLKPSVRDLSQFQALLFIGERVGNELARGQRTKELFVWDANRTELYRLAADDFGTPHLDPAH